MEFLSTWAWIFKCELHCKMILLPCFAGELWFQYLMLLFFLELQENSFNLLPGRWRHSFPYWVKWRLGLSVLRMYMLLITLFNLMVLCKKQPPIFVRKKKKKMWRTTASLLALCKPYFPSTLLSEETDFTNPWSFYVSVLQNQVDIQFSTSSWRFRSNVSSEKITGQLQADVSKTWSNIK